jgi:hypothetical protein
MDALLRQRLRHVGAEHALELVEAVEPKVLGKPHHGRGLHLTALRHVLDALQRQAVVVLLHVARDRFELLAQARKLGAHALQQRLGRFGRAREGADGPMRDRWRHRTGRFAHCAGRRQCG